MTTMVTANQLSKRFGHLLAVDDISLTVSRGEVLGFLGPNGSGKSTTMRIITGFIKQNEGQVEICGINMLENPVAARRRIGYLPEGAPVYADITTRAYLSFIADIRQLVGRTKRSAIDYAVDRTNIATVMHQPIGTLSKGYKRRVGLAQALLHNPDVLILDEPTDGLDPNQKHEVRLLIREILLEKAIIISTHILEEVETICDRALIIANGRIVAGGTPQELERRSRYHNAVSLTLPSSGIDLVRAELAALSGIAGVEIGSTSVGSTELIAVTNSGNDILPDIAATARQQGWPLQQLQIKRGNLDTVFRDVTTTDVSENETAVVTPSPILLEIKKSSLFRNVWAICRNELNNCFSTPLACVFIVIFLVSMGAFTFFLGDFFTHGLATLDSFFQFHPWLYLFFIPAVSMRMWAEERKTGSIEVLLTLPITALAAVLGKFFAIWMIVGLSLLLTTPFWFTVNYLGLPDNGTITAGYLGSFFMAGGYLSIGAFVSALTRNQVIAFIASAALCFVFTASGLSVVLEFFSSWAPPSVLGAVSNFSFLEHYRDISRGVIGLRDVVFFISTIAFFLFANVVFVERWKGT